MSKASVVFNLLTGGRREHFCARVGRKAIRSWRWAIVERFVNLWFEEYDHCFREYLRQLKR